jgi:hypothetical protein
MKRYVAFAVHSPEPGPLLAVAIAHRENGDIVVEAVKEHISVDDCAAVLKGYGISRVHGDVGDPSDAGAHAVLGAINLLSLQ